MRSAVSRKRKACECCDGRETTTFSRRAGQPSANLPKVPSQTGSTGDSAMLNQATRKDLSHVIDILSRHHASESFAWPLDRMRLANTVMVAIDHPDWLCLTSRECVLLASCGDSPLGAGRIAVEHTIVARGGEFAAAVAQYESWAAQRGCRATSLGCTSRFPAFERLYRRQGYRPAEMIFSKEL